jgi:hypothetical protein
MTVQRLSCVAMVLVFLAGCERAIVEGRAMNAQGEALPGVVVRLAGTDRQDLSDALGRYRLTASRNLGDARLQLSKSGYAPADVTVELHGRLLVDAPDATLWPLPLNPGVYTLRDAKYVAADWVLPKQYYLKDGSSSFGAELPEPLRAGADAAELFIVCYRTPRYNARLSRLASAEATVPGLDSEAQQIWVESGTIGAGLEPVDQPTGQLLRVVVDRPLEPGIYGVHWGAMEGYTTLENRVYAFEIVAPPEPDPEAGAEGASEGEGAGAEPKADTEADAAKPGPAIKPKPDLLEPPAEDDPPPQ